MRRAILGLVAVLIFQASAWSQSKAFDITTYTPPNGWQETVRADAVLLSKETSGGGVGMITLYRSIEASSNSDVNFTQAWDSLIKENLGVASAPARLPVAEEKGWRAESGHATFTFQGSNCAVLLLALTRGTTLVNVVVVVNSADYEKDVTAFTDSLSFKPAATVSAPSAPKAAPIGDGGPAPEVWTVTKFKIKPGYASAQMEPVWVAFYPNGDYFPYFPEGGFLGFDLGRTGQSWGKATRKGDTIAARSSYGNIDFVKKGADQMLSPNYTSNTWHRCRSVDGLKLEGTYTPDIDVYNNRPGLGPAPDRLPVITFRKDGTFTNTGISYANITRSPDYAIGSGTYQVKNFSLVMSYTDGRRVQVGFVGIKNVDPAGEPTLYFINNLLNYKMR